MRTAAAVTTATLALAMSLTTSAADARARNWTTVTGVAHAKLLACKDATTAGGPWRIRLRVDATDATTVVRGSAEVQDDHGDVVGKRWRSGAVHPGDVSTVGTVRLQRGSALRLEVQLASNSTGTGVIGPHLHRC